MYRGRILRVAIFTSKFMDPGRGSPYFQWKINIDSFRDDNQKNRAPLVTFDLAFCVGFDWLGSPYCVHGIWAKDPLFSDILTTVSPVARDDPASSLFYYPGVESDASRAFQAR